MLHTRLTEEYRLEAPFISAGMGFIALPELASAVSNAGGLGLLGVGASPPPVTQAMIRAIKSQTSRPFGVNLITDEHIEICVTEGIEVVVFFWNQPPARWIERLHGAGARVWMQVGSVEQARR